MSKKSKLTLAALTAGIAATGALLAQPATAAPAAAQQCGLYTNWAGGYYYHNCGGTGLVRFDFVRYGGGPSSSRTQCMAPNQEVYLGWAGAQKVTATQIQGPCRP
ncbi:hypothetical protein [Amycolatopsis sp. lyj-108]|uniref:hypothetical protein n=1 Tax=Amycolatopsis sp. lyj-108 TaxID=2789286 RepID=UPI00397CE66A